ncbi:family 15 glycosyl hydrolase [Massariosphaeria phaeospora]|uniref:Glucoamylase n=1 Tax=Massariosphaeria phaeospora TaxID=100035 RepID=A0A7C8M177_9PLEO|nr:family 15 glycosyl hydrolase [Massariosphaeria phaeospora]
MLLRSFFVALAGTTLYGAVAEPLRAGASLFTRIEQQSKISLQGVLNNIGPKGSKVPGAHAGAVVASPSASDPDYFFTWTRDASLTLKMIVDEFVHGERDLRPYIQDFVKAQAILQTVSNPSGALSSGRGLGEPKFYSNLTRFNGDWGRPQRDGPALRATALITYARWLLSTGRKRDASEAKDKIWPVVQNDLNYVAQYWNQTGFDLWEEVRGSSFFTVAVQHRALVEGASLGKRLGVKVSAYESQSPNLLCFLQTFWNGQYAVANINTQEGFSRTGLDANTVLASIATFDSEAKCDDALFQPCSPRALANLKAYVDSFRAIYTINQKLPKNAAVATGRYAEDVYYGGNPWYLTTTAVAEQLYDAIQQWSTYNTITITSVDLAFWTSLVPSTKPGTYRKGKGKQFTQLINAALDYADAFVSIALKYTPPSGALAEQYSRENGTAVSARDLTWSYAAFVTVRSARLAATSGHPQVPSWGAPAPPCIPSTCAPGSVPGVYKPATAAGAPPGAGGCTVLVTFNVNASTYFGENVYLSGSTAELGNWRDADALPGSASGYTQARPLWTFTAELPANSSLAYRYMRKEPDGNVIYESRNRTAGVPECSANVVGGTNSTIEDAWVGEVGSPSRRLL